jgi:hypothetical protein
MKKILCSLILLSFLLIVPMVFAADTQVVVTTKPSHEVTVNVLSIADQSQIVSIEGVSGTDGIFRTNFTSEANKVSIAVIVRKNGGMIKVEPAKEYYTGGSLSIDLSDKPVEPVVNNTIVPAVENKTIVEEPKIEENLTLTQTQEIKKSRTTGFAVSSIKSISSSKITYYIIGGLFIAAVFVFIMIRRKSENNFSKEFKTSNLKLNFQTPSNPSVDDDRILEAERKIQEARTELNDIRNRKGKIREAEEKLQRDKEELRKLKEE